MARGDGNIAKLMKCIINVVLEYIESKRYSKNRLYFYLVKLKDFAWACINDGYSSQNDGKRFYYSLLYFLTKKI